MDDEELLDAEDIALIERREVSFFVDFCSQRLPFSIETKVVNFCVPEKRALASFLFSRELNYLKRNSVSRKEIKSLISTSAEDVTIIDLTTNFCSGLTRYPFLSNFDTRMMSRAFNA